MLNLRKIVKKFYKNGQIIPETDENSQFRGYTFT